MKMHLTLNKRFRLSPLVLVLLALAGIAFVIAMIRFAVGIGAISNLNNAYPWAFWVSFDLFTGIAISSGAFVITSIVYIFELEQFRPLIRPTLLTGLLGYIMEVIALLVDLGHPERIWYYFIHQNFTSFLLVIGLYVMIYAALMLVEFAPAVFERFKLQKLAALIQQIHEAAGDPGRGPLNLAPGFAGGAAADPADQAASALVDAAAAGAFLHIRHCHRPGDDHL